MLFKKNILIILCVASPLFIEGAFAQINLVPNPSFEQLDSCPVFLNQIEFASPWFQSYITNSGSQNSSTDLFSTCGTSIYCSIPNNFNGNQAARTDSSYAGIIMYSQPSSHEYIETMLYNTLLTGKSYCVEFYISLSDNSKFAVSNIGVYFSNDSVLATTPPFILNYFPQIRNTDTTIVKDKTNWQLISLNYQANGSEQFITIGNFDADSITHISNVVGTKFKAYYYIDDISIIDISTPAYAGNDTTILLGDSVFVGRQPEIGLNDDCIWFVDGLPIDTVAGLWVTPTITTTYVLQQTICGTVTYDSVNVKLSGVGVDELGYNNSVKIYPNPTTGSFSIYISDEKIKSRSIVVEISDIAGNIIFSSSLQENENTSTIDTELRNGIYLVTIKDSKGLIGNPKRLTVIK
jgi:hypothetical protein